MSGQGRRWFEQSKGFEARTRTSDDSEDGPDLWTKCPGCGEALFLEVLAEHLRVCPHCGHHFPMEALDRLRLFADEEHFELHDTGLTSVDALGFVDSKPYDKRLASARDKLGRNEAFVAASLHLDGLPVEVGAMDWRFLGGSMGSVVGEAVTRLFERARVRRVPAIVVSASGGARMQEGVLSLMQMAKTSAAIARLKDEARMPYISLLTHPTTGGVAASFSTLGDVLVAEPGALIGFAGPRVIKETIGEELPSGFQTAEYLLEHGMVDLVVPRGRLRSTVARLLRLLLDERVPA